MGRSPSCLEVAALALVAVLGCSGDKPHSTGPDDVVASVARDAATGDVGGSIFAAASGRRTMPECSCSTINVKTPLPTLTPPPGTDPTRITLIFLNGSRVRLVDGALGFDPQGRSQEDLDELACAGLDPAAADTLLAEIRELLGANPSVSVKPVFSQSPMDLDERRDFGGRHCVSQGSKTLGDLGNYYMLALGGADREALVRAFDANRLVERVYYEHLPVPPGP